MIRGIAYWTLGILLTVLMFIFTLATIPFHRRRVNDYVHNMVRRWTTILLRCLLGVRVTRIGEERIDPERAYIIVSNHRSYTDILIGCSVMPLQFRWLAKESLFRIPLIGLGMRWAGYVPIVRERSRAASRSLGEIRRVLESGRSVWIFPEGTRTRRAELGRFKRGAFLVALETGVPILPVTLVHSDRIFVRPLVVGGRDVLVEYHEPVTPPRAGGTGGRVAREDEEKLKERIREIIQTSYTNHATEPPG
jgi:1-acyl-sn-glycerol-3-phosphate acyltransferase